MRTTVTTPMVSIHPMCRFKEVTIQEVVEVIVVSIHPMCRFKFLICLKVTFPSKFQYILCVGSSEDFTEESIVPLCFNTSYVSVQVLKKIHKGKK